MAILKSDVRNNFSTLPNSVIQTDKLSDGDYRLLIYLYSLPNSWKINQRQLGIKLHCNQRNINAKLKRIKEAGFLDIIKKGGEYLYILKEDNKSVNDTSVNDYTLEDNVLSNNVHIKEEEIKENKQKKKFQKPTIEELKKYCLESSLSVDYQYFYDYYESTGWMVGKKAMKDWKATLRNWNRKNKSTKEEKKEWI